MSHYTRREIIKMLAVGSTLLLAGCSSQMAREERVVVASPTKVPPFNASSPTPKPPTATPKPPTATPNPPTSSPLPSSPPQTVEPVVELEPTASVAEPLPSPTAASTGWQAPTETRITPNEAFYTMKYNPSPPPEVDLSDYRLVIEGEVDNPLTLTFDELKAYPTITQMRTLQCIGNPIGGELISNAVWVGISLAQLLEEAGLRPRGRFLKLESLDGYHTGIPRQLALHEDSLLAYQMNNDPLPAKHGYPLRCLFPGRYGQKQPKWITRITAQPTHHVGHWEGQGWDDDAIIQPSSIIEYPKDNGTVNADFVITGIAFTNDSGLESLVVTLDNGVTWQPAELLAAPSPYAWTMWWLEVKGAQAGSYQILAKVTDGTGHSQSRHRKSSVTDIAFPLGADEMHEISIRVGG